MKSNRREFFETVGAGAAGLAVGAGILSSASCSSGATKKEEEDGQILFVGDNIAVADTKYGKVRGYTLRGIHYFLGIPYGADTSGANRFMPPQPPEPWTDVFPALWWGNTAPQNMENRYANKYASFRDHWNYDDVSEDCLRINIFTPAINDGQKRPVMLWLHGGGYTNGNGIEHDGYNGENLARFGNIVFCSINHRLGPLGYCNLAGVGGEKFAASGNVGMLDIVAAMEWIRDNIANFGGDPANVTIMGQSGGGAKVCTLTAMPSAKGLFHKAVVLSGSSIRTGEKDYAEKLGSYVLKEAGLTPAQTGKLQEIPWKEFYAIAMKAQQKLAADLAPGDMMRRGFSPFVDGTIIPQHPYVPEPAPAAAEVPMIICSTLNEMAPSWTDAALENLSLEDVVGKVKERAGFGPGLGEKAREVVDAYAKAFPDKKPVEIWSMVSSNRQSVVALADAKSKQQAPVFVSWFCWKPPLFDNRIGAFHCVDICFWYYNTDLMLSHTGGGARPRKLSGKMAGYLLQFMKTGDPNGGPLQRWTKYTPENGEVMILDDVCEVKNDPDREARKALPPA
ncbi:MAG: carboxylesterase/lipase family protein [Acidobacteria bacterium]|nr:carboxylesterase/lipase family protein [Acidobacteriota bacterium]